MLSFVFKAVKLIPATYFFNRFTSRDVDGHRLFLRGLLVSPDGKGEDNCDQATFGTTYIDVSATVNIAGVDKGIYVYGCR
jgi:hypothetical protein